MERRPAMRTELWGWRALRTARTSTRPGRGWCGSGQPGSVTAWWLSATVRR